MFLKLRGRLQELGIDHKYLAKKLKMCPASLSGRMTGRIQWQMSEMYAVMDVIRIQHDRLHEYFPKGGKTPAEKVAS